MIVLLELFWWLLFDVFFSILVDWGFDVGEKRKSEIGPG
jgi:hypothetical protein